MGPAVFRMQVGVSLVGLAVCAGMLAAGRDPAIYLPVLTSIVGYWLPSPSRTPSPPPPAPSTASVAAVRKEDKDADEDLAKLLEHAP